MINFEFLNPTKIIFGKGTISSLGTELKSMGIKRVLFHYGGGSIKRLGLYDEVKKILEDEGIFYLELGGVQPNPRLALVYEGIKLCRENDIELVLAAGGGSVIDSAKAIAVGTVYDGDVWDFYTGDALPETKLPVATILTIPAAGSESSLSSVITNDEVGLKRPLDNKVLYPSFSILDPTYTFTLPPAQTANGVSDMLSHIMERYFSNTENTDISDRLCEGVAKTIITYGPVVYNEPENYEARAQIMWAGTIAHNGLLQTGRETDWASHMIEHELSAINDVAHGAGLSVVTPAWMKFVYKHNPRRFVQFATRFWNIDEDYCDQEATIMRGIDSLVAFYRSIGLPTTLKEIGIGEEHFKTIAENIRLFDYENGTVGRFVKLTRDDVISILELAK